MKLDDPCMPISPAKERNFFLACYAVSLAQGESLRNQALRAATIAQYISAATDILDERKCDYSCDDDPLGIILKALASYDDIEDRRHMICDDMMHWLHEHTKNLDPDSIAAAIVDWIKLGRYTGFRKSEWCQKSQSSYQRIDSWPGQPAEAFVWADFTFLDCRKRKLSPRQLSRQRVFYVIVRWRKQKNGDNGQEITYARDDDIPDFCPVRAALRIAQRALRLNIPTDTPLGKARHSKTKQIIFITDTLVTELLRVAAKAVYNLPMNDPELAKWSTHSIRVTAANLLHRERFSDSYIQTRLRWKSTQFLKYLRNTFYSATQHSTQLRLSTSNLPPPEERVFREPEDHEHIIASMPAPAA